MRFHARSLGEGGSGKAQTSSDVFHGRVNARSA
jgi:hypothetical protein